VRITYLPVLGTLRELYQMPRTMERFRSYIARLTGGTDDVVLPIGVANPMAKEPALQKLEALLDQGAEDIGAATTAEAQQRLAAIPCPVDITATLVLADDVGGGWTNRYTTEAMVRFPGRGALKRPFANGLVWTSESPTADDLHQEVLAAIYRVAYQQRRGLPATLAVMLDQEGLAGVFAGARPSLGDAALQHAREIIQAHVANATYPTAFACLYGDEAATQLGYQPLGLPPRAGFAVALADALEQQRDPIAALR
jgi:hypothetical protein